MTKPVTHQDDLAKLPRALAPLLDRKQWCIWRWTPKPDGTWQKPPFIATHPDRHANTRDPGTWVDYTTVLAAVQTGHGDGISYVLTAEDPFAAIDAPLHPRILPVKIMGLSWSAGPRRRC